MEYSSTFDDIRTRILNEQEDAFVVVDLKVVREQLSRWKLNLPRVSPWYAIKCHPDENIMRELYSSSPLSCGFDAASIVEMQAALKTGTPPNRIIFANPCKQPSHIRFAKSVGIELMTFDNVEEMRKIHDIFPTAKLVLRVLGDDSSSICKFNAKFGVGVDDCVPLLKEAKKLGMSLVGISFHVGSGCRSADAFVGAISNARRAFDLLNKFGFAPFLLDLGGGWPGSLFNENEPGEISFEEISSKVRPALDLFFPIEENIQIIAEPGRYFAHACASAVVNITSKRAIYEEKSSSSLPNLIEMVSSDDDTDSEDFHHSPIGFRYYVNDGVYGTFNSVICDHRDNLEPSFFLNSKGELIEAEEEQHKELFTCSIWGNSCDGIDKISSNVLLPDVPVGSWFVFRNMGAYTTSAASAGFNGFPIAKKFYVN